MVKELVSLRESREPDQDPNSLVAEIARNAIYNFNAFTEAVGIPKRDQPRLVKELRRLRELLVEAGCAPEVVESMNETIDSFRGDEP